MKDDYSLVIGRQLYRFVRELRVEVLEVSLGLDRRFVGRTDLLLVQHLPVDGAEERVRLDVSEARLRVAAQALHRILHGEDKGFNKRQNKNATHKKRVVT